MRLYQLDGGKTAVCEIPDTDGNIVNTITAKHTGNEISFCLRQAAAEISVEIYTGAQVQKMTIPAGTTSESDNCIERIISPILV